MRINPSVIVSIESIEGSEVLWESVFADLPAAFTETAKRVAAVKDCGHLSPTTRMLSGLDGNGTLVAILIEPTTEALGDAYNYLLHN